MVKLRTHHVVVLGVPCGVDRRTAPLWGQKGQRERWGAHQHREGTEMAVGVPSRQPQTTREVRGGLS